MELISGLSDFLSLISTALQRWNFVNMQKRGLFWRYKLWRHLCDVSCSCPAAAVWWRNAKAQGWVVKAPWCCSETGGYIRGISRLIHSPSALYREYYRVLVINKKVTVDNLSAKQVTFFWFSLPSSLEWGSVSRQTDSCLRLVSSHGWLVQSVRCLGMYLHDFPYFLDRITLPRTAMVCSILGQWYFIAYSKVCVS